jgi:hypothetical protein
VPAYLKKYGQLTLDQGYDIVFIRPGEKRPFGKEWEKTKHGPKRLAAALAAGREDFGVGIKTKLTPLVDIDCYDPEIVDHMIAFTEETVGPSLQRVGMAPKTGLLYRADKPFPKTQSRVFIDDEGRQVKLEVLGDGQQFVAFHIHPDTNEPYRWKDKRHPANTAADELETIVRDQAMELVREFEKLCREKGWPEKSTVKRLEGRGAGEYDDDDPFVSDKAKIELSTAEIQAKLAMVPNAEDHDTWFHVGMALYHQYDGSEEGLILWHEWSAQANNYDADDLDYRWTTFDVEGKKREPITARFILKLAKAEEERVAGEELDDVREQLRDASELAQIAQVCQRIKKIPFENLTRESLIKPIQDKLKAIANVQQSPTAVRKMIAYENPEMKAPPVWMNGYVYVQKDETFYSVRTRETLSKKAFDDTYNRYMLTRKDILEGQSVPANSASSVALNRVQIPIVHNRMYVPGEDDVFEISGVPYVNSYSQNAVPETPDVIPKKHQKIIDRVRGHFHHLFPNKKDRKLLLDSLAHIVQTNTRFNWAFLIQGAEGDGKTYFAGLMSAVLGHNNVRNILGENLGEKYTAWAEGSQFLFVEEVRLHGADRYAVVNKIKPFITNKMATIRRMNVDLYEVLNTISIVMTTNFKDGVPVNSEDTRYYSMFSRWQTRAQLDKFNAENPRYYAELAETLDHEYHGSLRRWLLDVKISKDFNPHKRAPLSSSRDEMIYLNKTEEEDAFEDALAEAAEQGHRDFGPALLNSALVAERLSDAGVTAPYGRLLKTFLSNHGFTYIGAAKDTDNKTRKWWSQTPEKFLKPDGKPNGDAIRAWLRQGEDEI